MEEIQTTYTVLIKKKVTKEYWTINRWNLRDLENSIREGYIKTKKEAFKYILLGEYKDSEIILEKQVYTQLPMHLRSNKESFVKYKGTTYPITKMYLDLDNKTFVMEAFVESQYIEKINYNELKKAFETDYETKLKYILEEANNKNTYKNNKGAFFKGYKSPFFKIK